MEDLIDLYTNKVMSYNFISKYVCLSKERLPDSDLSSVSLINYKEKKELDQVAASFLLLECLTLQRPVTTKHLKHVANVNISVGDVSTIRVNSVGFLCNNLYLQLLNLHFVVTNIPELEKDLRLTKQGLCIPIRDFFKESRHIITKEHFLIDKNKDIFHLFLRTSKILEKTKAHVFLLLSHLQFPF